VLRLEEGIGVLNQIEHQWGESEYTICGIGSLPA
jgi:hypothetical protein